MRTYGEARGGGGRRKGLLEGRDEERWVEEGDDGREEEVGEAR